RETSMAGIDIESGLAAFFEQDHRDCDARWVDVEELLDTLDVEAARLAWQKFNAGMRRHIAMEEEVLFPALESATSMGGSGPTAMMRMEHQQMRGLLDQIESAMESGDAEQAMDIGDTLLMLVQQHNIKEEGMLYPMAENVLAGSWDKLAALLEEY
ncbi:hemerythrin domain-containing protein, partial [Pseudomonadota bacterium]